MWRILVKFFNLFDDEQSIYLNHAYIMSSVVHLLSSVSRIPFMIVYGNDRRFWHGTMPLYYWLVLSSLYNNNRNISVGRVRICEMGFWWGSQGGRTREVNVCSVLLWIYEKLWWWFWMCFGFWLEHYFVSLSHWFFMIACCEREREI